MALKLDLDSWDLSDLEDLRDNRIPESNIVDYKGKLISDQDLVKMICGFANASGGFLVFGVKQSDEEPAYPVDFHGIAPEDLNTHRLEQVINTSIAPRLPVRSKVLDIPDSRNIILLIYTPEGSEKPYYSLKAHRFYLRYDRETREMTEAEISARYKERFVAEERINAYISETIRHHHQLCPAEVDSAGAPNDRRKAVYAHILIYPPNIRRRRIDTTNADVLDYKSLRYPPKDTQAGFDYLPGPRQPNKFGIEWGRDPGRWTTHRLEVHRNGLIHHADEYGKLMASSPKPSNGGEVVEQTLYLRDPSLGTDLLMTLQFADQVFQDIEYFGPVVVRICVPDTQNLRMPFEKSERWLGRQLTSRSERIEVEREWNSWELAKDYARIAKSIMDEYSNHFGLWENPSFREGGSLHRLLQGDED